jgi:hypothetical protein
MALLKGKTENSTRVYLRRDWFPGPTASLGAGTVLDLAPAVFDDPRIREQLDAGVMDLVPADRAVPIGREIPAITPEDLERWFRVPPPPAPETFLTSREIGRTLGWANFDYERAARFGFPTPTSHRMERQRFGFGYDRVAVFRETAVRAWLTDIRALLAEINVAEIK